jgi:hypothetical protein
MRSSDEMACVTSAAGPLLKAYHSYLNGGRDVDARSNFIRFAICYGENGHEVLLRRCASNKSAYDRAVSCKAEGEPARCSSSGEGWTLDQFKSFMNEWLKQWIQAAGRGGTFSRATPF